LLFEKQSAQRHIIRVRIHHLLPKRFEAFAVTEFTIIIIIIVVVIFVVFNMTIDHPVPFLTKESENQLSLYLSNNCARQCDCTLAVRIYHASLENIQQSPNNEMVINTKWLLPHSTHLINQPPSYPSRFLP
jgi:hypothetical protein